MATSAKITEQNKLWRATIKVDGIRRRTETDPSLYVLLDRVSRDYPGVVFLPATYAAIAKRAAKPVDVSKLFPRSES